MKFKIFTSVVAGAAAGAIVGFLLAPDEDSDAGREISKKADKFAKEMQRIINSYNTDIKKHLESVKKETKDLTED